MTPQKKFGVLTDNDDDIEWFDTFEEAAKLAEKGEPMKITSYVVEVRAVFRPKQGSSG